MARVRLTEQAQSELEAIIEYYERVGSSDLAEVFEERVIDRIRRLEQFPRMGREVPEIGDDSIRELLHRNFRIVYFVGVEDEEVEVLTIFHSSQLFGPLGSAEE